MHKDLNIKNRLILYYAGLVVFILLVSCNNPKSDWRQAELLLEQIKPVTFPQQDFLLTSFGATGDGISDCTEAFRLAIDACHQAGGGRVVVPAGRYLTGAIHLSSNVNLYISENATVLFDQDPHKYLPPVYTRWEGIECMNYSPLVYAYGKENVAVTGKGVLDGQADNEHWWPWKGHSEYGWDEQEAHQDKARQQLFAMSGEDVPVEKRIMGEGSYLRPQFIQFYNCKNVLIEGVTITNSPMWLIHPVLGENIIINDVKLISHGPNNDGCNPESCRNVVIKNSYFDNGDDCIAIKSGRNSDGRRVNIPCENIVIHNCMMKDGHGGVVLGSEISGNARNIYVQDCIMDSPNLERMLRIKTNSLRGGIIENIFMRNITVGQVAEALIRVDLNYEEGDAGSHVPVIRKIHISHVTSNKSKYVLWLDGYDRSPVSDIMLDYCDFNGVEEENIINHVRRLKLNQVYINGQLHNQQL
ncbi:MAG TPA: glycoside hydrolase family 28 protein [bacterium]|nr:glycoside hydrolase family 28 protein [bacterium]HPN44080.1 glycoside hydrolase family 28 protein [bacterium]